MSIDTIKHFCATLQEYNISHVTATYDGSGDSGDMDVMFKRNAYHAPIGNSEPTHTETWLSEDQAKNVITSKGSGHASPSAFEEFIEALWSTLPGGWEINDGAYGEINVEVANRTVRTEHNERYTEITTTERTY